MKILNETRKTTITKKTEIASNFWRNALGLMFRGGLDDSAGFLLEFSEEGSHGIWMLGMRFKIDLVFIDASKRVVDVFPDVKPVGMSPATWKVYRPSKPARWVLELKSGTAKSKGTSIGDKLSW
jgi:uncharacterized membrane protein (UPF0127 family)